MKHYDLLIIGGDAAGMSAASQARRMDEKISIGVFNKGEHVSYAACGMPYYIGDDVKEHTSLLAVDREKFEKKKNIKVYTGAEITAVKFTEKTVTARHNNENNKSEEEFSYNNLVIATGARAVAPPIEGLDSSGVFFLRGLDHGISIKDYVKNSRPGKALIIGAGFIGLEMAEAFTTQGIQTTIVERMECPAMTMSPPVREKISEVLEENKVALHTGITVKKIEEKNNSLQVHTDNRTFDADIVIVSTGVTPNTEFLAGSGLEMTEKGAIIVNEKSETSIKGVYAAGDCATARHLITGRDTYMPLGTTANRQGRVAGLQAAGIETERFPGIVGTQFVKVFKLEVGKTGLNKFEAEKEGIPVEVVSGTWNSRAGYCPASEKILVIITYNPETRKIIGAEITGKDQAALRVNTLATAITAGMTIDEFAYTDLGYAPPFSPVWDPTVATAQMAVKRK